MTKELFVVRNKHGMFLCDVDYTVTLDINNNDGERADLRYADLSNANLSNADLSNADLRYAWDMGFDSNDLEIIPLSEAFDKVMKEEE